MEPERTLRELGFYPSAGGSYYRMVPRCVAVNPLSHGQWAVVVGTPPSEAPVVFPTLEAAVVWLKVDGLCQGGFLL